MQGYTKGLKHTTKRTPRADTSLPGKVLGVGPGKVTVQLSNNGGLLTNVDLVGKGTPALGDQVLISYLTTDKPVAHTLAGEFADEAAEEGVAISDVITEDDEAALSTITTLPAFNYTGTPAHFSDSGSYNTIITLSFTLAEIKTCVVHTTFRISYGVPLGNMDGRWGITFTAGGSDLKIKGGDWYEDLQENSVSNLYHLKSLHWIIEDLGIGTYTIALREKFDTAIYRSYYLPLLSIS